jgi:uncharacterized protein YuzE
MAKVRTLVPLTHPKTGEQFAAGTEVDVDDEVFKDWRADGKVADIAVEEEQAKQPGHYSDVTGREATTSTTPTPKSKK